MFDLTVIAGTARLVLGRPEARNAISLTGWAELTDAAQAALRQDARLLILTGEPDGAFCAGADISDFESFRDDAAARARFREAIRQGLDALRDLPIPTVAVVEGVCYGAGVALAMACDLRIAGAGASFAITPAKLGIAYPQEDVHRLVSLVGPGQAARLLFGAGSIDAGEAARIGLVEWAVEDAEIAVQGFATMVAANDRESLRVLKHGVRLASLGVNQNDGQDRAFESLLGSDALAERLTVHRGRKK